MNTIKDTCIYKYLKQKDSQFAVIIDRCYYDVATILNAIPGQYPNYTFHDEGHAYRVCRYMEILAFDNECKFNTIEKFNDGELALILLSALFHDTGMYYYFDDYLNEIKGGLFCGQKFNYEKIKNDYENDLEMIKELTRKHHHLLSQKFVNSEPFTGYLKIQNLDLTEPLGLLCMSHCCDNDFIESLPDEQYFNEDKYNLKYIATLLRIADALDCDSSRVPVFWFLKNNVKGFSKEEWERHFFITNNLKSRFRTDFNNNLEILFSGNCVKHLAYRSFSNYLSTWLEPLVAFSIDICSTFDVVHRLYLSRKISNEILTIGFDASDLRLTLNYSTIKNLLMGENIYGDKRAGLREIIQNSIDACCVKKDYYKKSNIPEEYIPEIKICINHDKNEFFILDNGSGMNDKIINQNFLNIGNSYYSSSDFAKLDLDYKPIGRFGIGFLACYLLADEIKLSTRHMLSSITKTLHLDTNSNYVVCNTDDLMFNSGTKISFNLSSILKIFKTEEEIKNYIMNWFIFDKINFIFDVDGFTIPLVNTIETLSNKLLDSLTLSKNTLNHDINFTDENVQCIASFSHDKDEFNIFKGPLKLFKFAKNGFEEANVNDIKNGDYYAIFLPNNFKPDINYKNIKSLILKGEYNLFIFDNKHKDTFFNNDSLKKEFAKINILVPSFLVKTTNEIVKRKVFIFDGKIYSACFTLTSPFENDKLYIFKKNVLISNEFFVFISSILNIKFNFLIINIKDDFVSLDVSRNKIIQGLNLLNDKIKSILVNDVINDFDGELQKIVLNSLTNVSIELLTNDDTDK